MRKILLALAAASATLTAAVPAEARRHADRYERHHPQRYYTSGNGIRYWRGDNGRYYCRRSDGTTGLIVGAAAGALAGRAVDTRGDRAPGTIIGAVVGGLLGRQIERGEVRCR